MANCIYCKESLEPKDLWRGAHVECINNNPPNPEKESFEKEIENIKTTTAFSFAENEIQTELKVISAECVFGMNIFRDFFAGLTDFFGGRSEASQKILRDARETCLYELKREAYEIGADGIIGIDLDYQEISGKGKGMLFLVASGTAVKFK